MGSLANGKDGSEKEAIEFIRGSFGAKQKQQRVVVLINAAFVGKAEAFNRDVRALHEERAEFPFAGILDRITSF